MCVRCGTGKVAWCTDPFRHAVDRQPKVLAETVEHFRGAFYSTAMNMTPNSIHGGIDAPMEVLKRHERPNEHAPFVPNEWSLVLRNLPRAKAEAICMILNAED